MVQQTRGERSRALGGRFVLALTGLLGLHVACGSDDAESALTRAQLAQVCYIDSDCTAPMKCAFRKCHVECESARDCSDGARCVPVVKPLNVCQQPDETHCNYNSDCPGDLRCGSDRQCRAQCQGDSDCLEGQLCITGVCADIVELVDGALPVPEGGALPNTGQACSLNSDCVAPLKCRFGFCQPECRKDVDCENASRPVCRHDVCVPAGNCNPATCETLGANCGRALDGCGGTIQCGECADGEVCGGGGPNKCGTTECQPKLCTRYVDCALRSDGCADVVDCGLCGGNDTCGATGVPNVCGCVSDGKACEGKQCGSVKDNCGVSVDCGTCSAPLVCGSGNQCACTQKKTCQAGDCGQMPDGCGSLIDCGNPCKSGEVCGGGGANRCGTTPCTPIASCNSVGKDCGYISNGCDGVLTCGGCNAPETCGGSGTANVCGCTKKSCGGKCGSIDDGCGGTLSCGCAAPLTCGNANTCVCQKKTCEAGDCGSIDNGCGAVDCGQCGGGQACVANQCTSAGISKSCNAIAADCGPNKDQNCCDSPKVTGSSPDVYLRYFESGTPVVQQYPMKVSAYHLDAYEVTIGRYRQFLSAGAGNYAFGGSAPPQGAGANPIVATTLPSGGGISTGWDPAWNVFLPTDYADAISKLQNCDGQGTGTITQFPAGNENFPLSCMTWFEAFAFCAWDGGYLPTWGQWAYAYNGGTEYRPYPWGSETETSCDQDAIGCAPNDFWAGKHSGSVGRFGQYNLAGSVAEWLFDAPYPANDPSMMPDCSGGDCAYRPPVAISNATTTSKAIVAGGANQPSSIQQDGGVGPSCYEYSWSFPDKHGFLNYMSCYESGYTVGPVMTQRSPTIGFRCARVGP